MMNNDVLSSLYAIRVTLDTVDFQRDSYNKLMGSYNTAEAVQQLKSMQNQLQSIMTAYNSTLDKLNAAVNEPPEQIDPF